MRGDLMKAKAEIRIMQLAWLRQMEVKMSGSGRRFSFGVRF